ncbi:MAG: sigma-70 family RNA polymerase sigma factor [Planctomycetota bacterium]
MSSTNLLLRMHRGDEGAARALWDSLGPALVAYVRASRPGASAEDAVQEAFLSALRMQRRELKKVRDVRAWMYRLVRNAAMNQLRSETRLRAREAASPVPEPAQEQGSTTDQLWCLVADLPDDQREAVVLKHVAGLTFDQASIVLEIPRSTIAGRYKSAIESLRVSERAPGGEPERRKAHV